jgi:tetratricopeptide (TPR) repeat protein
MSKKKNEFEAEAQYAKDFLDYVNSRREEGLSDLEIAQDLVYNAWEAPSRKEAIALAIKATIVSKDCADAYNLLAEETSQSDEDVIELYQLGVEAGKRAIGEEAFEEDVGYFWGLLHTRPYMRARLGLAMSLWKICDYEAAVDHYKELIRLNPNDNQGVRDILMPCLIELNRDEEAEILYKQYEGEDMSGWLYSRTLLDFRKYKTSPTSLKSLKRAFNANTYIPEYILENERIPDFLPELYSIGSDNEAIIYAAYNINAWKTSEDAIGWLREQISKFKNK